MSIVLDSAQIVLCSGVIRDIRANAPLRDCGWKMEMLATSSRSSTSVMILVALGALFGCVQDPACPEGSSLIDGRCLYQLTTESENATCGGICASVPNAEYDCEGLSLQEPVQCDWSCADGFADCDGIADNGCEAEIGTEFHCAQCGNACGDYQICWRNSCVEFVEGWTRILPAEHEGGARVDLVGLSTGHACIGSEYAAQLSFGSKSYAPEGDADLIVACYDEQGDAAQSFSISGAGVERLVRAQVDKDDNIYLLGTYSDGISVPGVESIQTPVGSGVFIVSTNSEGKFRWARVFESTDAVEPTALSVAHGRVLFGGFAEGDISYGQEDCDIRNVADTKLQRGLVAAMNLEGQDCVGQAFNGSGRAHVRDVLVYSEDAILVTGDSEGKLSIGDKEYQNRGSGDAWLARLKAQMELQWIDYWGSDADEYSDWIAVNADGSLLWGGQIGPVILGDDLKSLRWNRLRISADGRLLDALPDTFIYQEGFSNSHATKFPDFGNVLTLPGTELNAELVFYDGKGRSRYFFNVNGVESGQAFMNPNRFVVGSNCYYCGDATVTEYRIE